MNVTLTKEQLNVLVEKACSRACLDNYLKEKYREFIGAVEAEIGIATEEIQFFESAEESDYDMWDQSDYAEYQSWRNHKSHYESVLNWWKDQCEEFKWTRKEFQEQLAESQKWYKKYNFITEYMMNCGMVDAHHDAWEDLEITRCLVNKKTLALEEFNNFLELGQLV